MLLLRSIFAILFTQKIGQVLSTSLMFTSCFHRSVSCQQGQKSDVQREHGKIKITYKAFPYQSVIKIVKKKKLLCTAFSPSEIRKNKQKMATCHSCHRMGEGWFIVMQKPAWPISRSVLPDSSLLIYSGKIQ